MARRAKPKITLPASAAKQFSENVNATAEMRARLEDKGIVPLPDNELERYAHARAVMKKPRDVALAYGCGILGGAVTGQKSANLLLKIDNKADMVKARIAALGGPPDNIFNGL
jgi:hypothetical protein